MVVNCGGVPVHVAAPKEAPAAISPNPDTKPVMPAEQMASTLMLKAQLEAAKASLVARFPNPSTQDGTVHLASQLRLTITRWRASANDGIDVITHANC